MIAVYTTCFNQCDLIDDFLKSIPEDVDIFITDMGSTDGSFEKLKATRANVYQAEFDPYDEARGLEFTLVQIHPSCEYAFNLNLGEEICPEFIEGVMGCLNETKADAITVSAIVFDDDDHPDFVSREIRLHRYNSKWKWFYNVEPRLASRDSNQDIVSYNAVGIGKYEREVTEQRVVAAALSADRYPSPLSKLTYADYLLNYGQTTEATKVYLEVTKTECNEAAQAYNSLAYINSTSGIPDLRYLLQYHALTHTIPESHLELARFYYKKGWAECGLGYAYSGLRLARSANKTDNLTEELGCVWKLLDIAAHCHLKNGNDLLALSCMQQAVKANPNHERLKTNFNNLSFKLKTAGNKKWPE